MRTLDYIRFIFRLNNTSKKPIKKYRLAGQFIELKVANIHLERDWELDIAM